MKTFGTNSRATIFASIVASAVAFLPGGAEATSNDPVERDMPNPICETFTVKDVSRVPPGHEPSGAEFELAWLYTWQPHFRCRQQRLD